MTIDSDNTFYPSEWKEGDAPKVAADLRLMSEHLCEEVFTASYTEKRRLRTTGVDLSRLDIRALTASNRDTTKVPEFTLALNSKRLDLPRWALYEGLFHELAHIYTAPQAGYQLHAEGYHNRKFVNSCLAAGIYVRIEAGTHFKPATGRFADLMRKMNIGLPENISEVDEDKRRTNWWDQTFPRPAGHSTMYRYTRVECRRNTPCIIRSGKSDLQLSCDQCWSKFVLD
jgi:hypothetical protein